MQLSVTIIVAFLAYMIAEILKVFSVDKKYLPLINLLVGVVAGLLSYWLKIVEVGTPADFITAMIMAITAALGAGGFYDLIKQKNTDIKDGILLISEHDDSDGGIG